MRSTGSTTVIRRQSLPAAALSARYARDGAFADCYFTDIPRRVTHAQYVEAFYTTWLFKLERAILAWLVKMPSTDAQAAELARALRDAFAAWTVEARAPDQLLMRDFRGRTRSWLMVAPMETDAATRLYFGSVVVPVVDEKSGEKGMSFGFRALIGGFHGLYSRALLRAARSRLLRTA